MANKCYVGVSGKARECKKIYIGVNGTARQVKKGYVGDANGKARLFFTSSSLPSGYQQKEWIRTHAVNAFATGIYPTQSTGYDITVKCLSTSGQQCFAIYDTGDTSTYGYALIFTDSTSTVGGRVCCASDRTTHVYNGIGYVYNTKLTYKLRNGVFTKPDGTTMTVGSGTFTCAYPLTFGIQTGGASWGGALPDLYIYSLKFYNGTTLIRNYYPCLRTSDSQPGLYDVVNNSFLAPTHYNGTTTPTYGSDCSEEL